MRFEHSRRSFLSRSMLVAGSVIAYDQRAMAGDSFDLRSDKETEVKSRIKGLLLGSIIGDAVGGPVEFQDPEKTSQVMPNCRDWPNDRKVTSEDLLQFGKSLRHISYRHFRPDPEPYGQWSANASPGTVTDDTRHKIVFLNALRDAIKSNQFPITDRHLATAYLQFANTPPIAKRPEYAALCEESFREFWKSAEWLLGNRDLKVAAPPERIWGGVPTCVGQMILPPLATLYPGQPMKAYRAAYALSFFDVGAAKDINPAVVAGLSSALRQKTPADSSERKHAWQAIISVMRTTDPFRYAEVPYVTRPVTRWLDFAHDIVTRSKGIPSKLFELLETEGEVKYYWESHFVLALVFAAIEFCEYDPLAAMYLILNFGHDTDSAAQLLGAFAGALHGPALFPQRLWQPVNRQLLADYDESVEDWTDLLHSLSDEAKYPRIVAFE